jgi:ABC-2 type transport system ATP-binding protein
LRVEHTIEVDDVAVVYRSFGSRPVTALDGVSMRARKGEIVGVLGPNGSGKTSLLAVVAGNLEPTAGRVTVLGQSATAPDLLRRVGYQPEGAPPFAWCTPLACLQRLAAMLGVPFSKSRARCEQLLLQVGLGDVARTRKVGKLSTGMARRLALAAALLPDPAVLVLDEPTSGLDPEGSLLVIDLLRQRARDGGTVLLASHHLQEVEQICTRVVLLHAGCIAVEGTLDELLGTAQLELLVDGLNTEGVRAVADAVARAGGRVVRTARHREHLFALFRRLRQQDSAERSRSEQDVAR